MNTPSLDRSFQQPVTLPAVVKPAGLLSKIFSCFSGNSGTKVNSPVDLRHPLKLKDLPEDMLGEISKLLTEKKDIISIMGTKVFNRTKIAQGCDAKELPYALIACYRTLPDIQKKYIVLRLSQADKITDSAYVMSRIKSYFVLHSYKGDNPNDVKFEKAFYTLLQAEQQATGVAKINAKHMTDAKLVRFINQLKASNIKLLDIDFNEAKNLDSPLKDLSSSLINVFEARKVIDADFEHLQNNHSLTSLDLSRCEKLTDETLKHLQGCIWLRKLVLGRFEEVLELRGNAIGHGCSKDPEIAIEEKEALKNKFTDAGLAYLTELTELEHLDLAWTEITDAGMKTLGEFVNLKYLDLSQCFKINAHSFRHLRSLSKLETLVIRGNELGPNHVKDILGRRFFYPNPQDPLTRRYLEIVIR